MWLRLKALGKLQKLGCLACLVVGLQCFCCQLRILPGSRGTLGWSVGSPSRWRTLAFMPVSARLRKHAAVQEHPAHIGWLVVVALVQEEVGVLVVVVSLPLKSGARTRQGGVSCQSEFELRSGLVFLHHFVELGCLVVLFNKGLGDDERNRSVWQLLKVGHGRVSSSCAIRLASPGSRSVQGAPRHTA